MKKNKQADSAAPPQNTESGNFGAGFFLGLVGGAVGMFLLGTKQGHQVLQNIKEQVSDKSDDVIEPETKQKLIAAATDVVETAKESANNWQEKFPKFQKKDSSS